MSVRYSRLVIMWLVWLTRWKCRCDDANDDDYGDDDGDRGSSRS